MNIILYRRNGHNIFKMFFSLKRPQRLYVPLSPLCSW